jgi:hypothetical protein
MAAERISPAVPPSAVRRKESSTRSDVESEALPESVVVVTAARWSTAYSRVSGDHVMGHIDGAGTSTITGGGAAAGGIGWRGTGETHAVMSSSADKPIREEDGVRESPGL